ncbi:aminopyrimidine aminohydrolase-like [Amphiura filiformis]|uniref:aminopyrimidine aminohydrolase-like n=1 Tax=Amphiura filiformis TaxID=82378 RepID=UPI003B220929
MSSFCDEMWVQCKHIAEEGYQTAFIQGICKGTLDPTSYSGFMNQDIAYVFKAAELFDTVATRAKDEDLKMFARNRQQSFLRCANEMCEKFFIQDPSAIRVGETLEEYCQYLHRVANGMDPLYFMVAMIPCSKLWPWLARKMQHSEVNPNLYGFWAKENMSDSCSAKLESFVAERVSELDEQTSLLVYQTCMTAEVNFFKSATGEEISDISNLTAKLPVRLASA